MSYHSFRFGAYCKSSGCFPRLRLFLSSSAVTSIAGKGNVHLMMRLIMCLNVNRAMPRVYMYRMFGHRTKTVKILDYLHAIGVVHHGRLTDLGHQLKVEMWEDFELWYYGRDRAKEKREKAMLASSPSPDTHTAPLS